MAFTPLSNGSEVVTKYKVVPPPTWVGPIFDGNRGFVKDRDSITTRTLV